MAGSKLEGMETAQRNTDALKKLPKASVRIGASLPAAKVFYAGAYRRAPYDPKRKKGTHLRDAIFIDAREHGGNVDVLVGVNEKKAPHGHLQEFGWSSNPSGHPFMRPTAVEDEAAIRAAFVGGMNNVIDDQIK